MSHNGPVTTANVIRINEIIETCFEVSSFDNNNYSKKKKKTMHNR